MEVPSGTSRFLDVGGMKLSLPLVNWPFQWDGEKFVLIDSELRLFRGGFLSKDVFASCVGKLKL